jgi:hypothetical protein
MAKACAPYVHPKLAAVTHAGDPDNPIKMESDPSDTDIARRLAFILTQAALRSKGSRKSGDYP